MSQSQAAVGPDRLPWLDDEPTPPAKRGSMQHAPFAVGAFLLVAGLSYWMGARTSQQAALPEPSASSGVTVTLPRALPAQDASPASPAIESDRVPQVQAVVEPIVRPATQPQLPIDKAEPRPPVTSDVAKSIDSPQSPMAQIAPPQVAAPQIAANPRTAPVKIVQPALVLWPARTVAGADGRLVRIGAFGSSLQAKRGWWTMVRAFPAVQRLPAVVTGARNSKGRRFYRFQIGTTSQAHSEVLCQRMRKIHLSCAVVGLPWKPGGVER